MPKTRPPSPPEERRRLVELVRAGRSPARLAEEFEPSEQVIRNRVRQADLDEGTRTDGLTTTEREALARRRRENRQLREEREILKKAAAWFAQASRAIPPKGSPSCARIRPSVPSPRCARCGVSPPVASPRGAPGPCRRERRRTWP